MPTASSSAACSVIDHVPAVAPLLVIGIGNPSRGDDALGPACLERLAATLPPGVELLTDFQLQIEHALDLDGRALVVFVDASVAAPAPCTLAPVIETSAEPAFSHALSPAQLLGVYRRVQRRAPPRAMVLAIRGDSFELGDGLSACARDNLEQALAALTTLLAEAAPAQAAA
jgi:hydrogenase maturation protease